MDFFVERCLLFEIRHKINSTADYGITDNEAEIEKKTNHVRGRKKK